MNSKISTPVAIVIVIVVVGLVVAFGYRKVTGGPDADVTQQVIAHYKQAAQANPAPGAAPGGVRDSGASTKKTGDDAAGAKQYH